MLWLSKEILKSANKYTVPFGKNYCNIFHLNLSRSNVDASMTAQMCVVGHGTAEN